MPRPSYRCRLPHVRVDGATYFVTWRVRRDQPDLAFTERAVVMATILHARGRRFQLDAVVVMNDHVHVIVTPGEGHSVEGIVQAWKGVSAVRLRTAGRLGGCWQREYYDRVIRGPRAFEATLRYVEQNPARRWPGIRDYPFLWLASRDDSASSGEAM